MDIYCGPPPPPLFHAVSRYRSAHGRGGGECGRGEVVWRRRRLRRLLLPSLPAREMTKIFLYRRGAGGREQGKVGGWVGVGTLFQP